MRKGLTHAVIALLAGTMVLNQGCKKEDNLGIDNDKIIQTPYSLFVSTDLGWILKTNDGESYDAVMPADGFPPVSILTPHNNLILVKNNVHLSEDNGKNFNPVYLHVNHFPWQQIAVFSEQQDRIYITSTQGNGIAYSADTGKTWITDNEWDSPLPPGFQISSFATTADGAVYAFSYNNFALFKKDNKDDKWTVVTMIGLLPGPFSQYFITAVDNRLYLTDYSGQYDMWYSDDGGVNWNRYFHNNMPYVHYNDANAAPGGPLLVATDSFGVYRAQDSGMVMSSVGLEEFTTVYRIVNKKNIYKNGTVSDYVFISTSNGIYRSEDKGFTWDKLTSGQYNRKYVSMH